MLISIQSFLYIFILIEVLIVLQSDNVRKSSNRVFSNIKDLPPELEIVHGKSS